MSHPEEPTPKGTTPVPDESSDAQPTAAYPPVPEMPAAYATENPAYGQDDQQTAAYPPPAPQPTAAYPQYAPPSAYAQQPAPYGSPAAGYAAPTPQPSGPDTRPKTLGWVSLGLAILGVVLASVAFIPMMWVSLVLALVGGLLLLVALILGIVTLANKKQGGKGFGIGAIVVSVLGSGVWIGAIIWSIVIIGLGTAGWDSGSEGLPPGVEQSEGGSATAGGEEAFLAEVRPELLTLFQEIDPAITLELMETAFPDDALISMGEGSLLAGDAGRDAMVEVLAQSSGGAFTPEQAAEFYDVVHSAAQEHLAD
ncbi:hypothetical protein [Microbacterium sp. SLBN-146]|uniref:hypothetical protein n=1 Tax=Microbacterium sp. SLBN-146 TaxID=2768457 RepID=UPI001152606D|nr:hypothetical protein [Microbacterium sp. SLBN-146]TQJ30985.1 hypothetical protein FBY39_1444 [Microbacterium sp. SLBN-146]